MINENPTYKRGVLIPDDVDPSLTKKDIYSRQFLEAESITEFFRKKTPVQILADDVGTGKTWVGMMTLFSCLDAEDKNEPSECKGNKRIKRRHALVVAPTRMVADKWIRELYRFNQNFIKKPENTSIDQLNSTKELLEALEADKKAFVSQSYSLLAELFRCKGETRRRSNDAPKVLLLHLLDGATGYTEKKGSKNNQRHSNDQNSSVEKYRNEFKKSHRKGPLNSMLLQRDTIRVIKNLARYNRSKDSWYCTDFDHLQLPIPSNREQDLNKLIKSLEQLTSEFVKSPNKDTIKSKINYVVQTVSVLWSVNKRVLDVPQDSVFAKNSDTELHNIFKHKLNSDKNRDIQEVLHVILTIFFHGLHPENGPLINSFKSKLIELIKLYNVNLTAPYLNEQRSNRIVRMLVAYANRLEWLSGFPIKITDRFMERYAAAGVFQSSSNLHEQFKYIKEYSSQIKNDGFKSSDNKQINTWEQFFNFVDPLIEEAIYLNNLKNESSLAGNHLTKRNNAFALMVKRVGRAILQLIDYEAHPDRVGSTFWFEGPKERAIHVMYMNDLKLKGYEKQLQKKKRETTEKELEDKNACDKLIVDLKKSQLLKLAIIDEAHNWRNRAFGAKTFQQYIQPCVSRTLLVTATPLHMGVTDLKSIIDLSLGLDKVRTINYENLEHLFKKNEFLEFQQNYKALFSSNNEYHADAEKLLLKAQSLRNKVTKAYRSLIRNHEAINIIEEIKNQIAAYSHDNNFKKIQKDIWSNLERNLYVNIHLKNLAKAINAFVDFQENKILKQLLLMVIKTRAQKYHLDGKGNKIGKRRYLCGSEARLDDLHPADEQHLILHDHEGVENHASGWVDFIGMRLSRMKININQNTTKKSARLLLALPSSYNALNESSVISEFKSSQNLSYSKITHSYFEIFKAITENDSLKHPKVKRTIDIMFDRFKHGEKTLVFCQRIATVRIINTEFKKRLSNIINKHIEKIPAIDRNSLIGIDEIFQLACKYAKTISSFIDFTKLIGNSKFDEFYEFIIHNSINKNIKAIDFDSRVIWLVSESFKKLISQLNKKQKLPLISHLRSLELDESSANSFFNSHTNTDTEQTHQNALDTESELDAAIAAGFEVSEMVTGDTSYRDEIRANFSSPFYPLALVCSQVSQEGVDMHRYCSTIILHDLNWNPAVLEQRVGRLDRVGSYASELHRPVDVFIPYLADSYDEYQYARVLQRAELQELIFGCNDTVISDKGWEEKDDTEVTGEFSSQFREELNSVENNIPLLGNLIHGLFDMDLSVSKRNELGSVL